MAPNAAKIEATLRKTVTKLHAAKDHDKLTINGVRKEVEQSLDLDDGFLRSDATWKVKSKNIIKDQMSKVDDEDSDSDVKEASPPPKAPKKTSKPGKPAAKPTKQSKKRKASSDEEAEESAQESSDKFSDASEPPSKKKKTTNAKATSKAKAPAKSTKAINGRRKPSQVASDDEGSEEDAQSAKPAAKRKSVTKPAQPVQPKKSEAVIDSDEEAEDSERGKSAEVDSGSKEPSSEIVRGDRKSPSLSDLDDEQETKIPKAQEDGDKSESEMSIVIDEPPARLRKSSKAGTTGKSSKKPAKAKKEPAKSSTGDPQLDEIKTLQSHLLKCGIRKLWHRELAPHDTSKDKIRHLKKMLADVGMTGKFSASKAAEIKERRELLAEVEAAQEFEEAHGENKDDDEDEEQVGRSAARSKRISRAGGSAMLADLGFGDEDSDSDD